MRSACVWPQLFAGIVTAIFIIVRQKECVAEIRASGVPPPAKAVKAA